VGERENEDSFFTHTQERTVFVVAACAVGSEIQTHTKRKKKQRNNERTFQPGRDARLRHRRVQSEGFRCGGSLYIFPVPLLRECRAERTFCSISQFPFFLSACCRSCIFLFVVPILDCRSSIVSPGRQRTPIIIIKTSLVCFFGCLAFWFFVLFPCLFAFFPLPGEGVLLFFIFPSFFAQITWWHRRAPCSR